MQCAYAMSSVDSPALPYFSTLSYKRHNFRGKKKLLNTKCVFWFSLQLLSEAVLILRRTERDMIINLFKSQCTAPTRYSCQILIKLDFTSTNFQRKYPNIKFHENLSGGSRAVPCGRAGRHDEANSHFSQYFKCAYKRASAGEHTSSYESRL